MEYTETEIKEAIEELNQVMNYNDGNRASITDVDGLNSVGHGSDDQMINDKVTQIKFYNPLTKKQLKYVNNAMNCGSVVNIVEIARIMNMLDCDFDTAAKAYFTNGSNSYKILMKCGNKKHKSVL